MKGRSKIVYIAFFALVLAIPLVLFAFYNEVMVGQQKLEILGPVTKTSEGVEYHKIGDFSFTDQSAEDVSMDRASGKILIANFFFTACPTICPEMTTQLSRVQKSITPEDAVIFSFSVDPERDNPEILSLYADNYEVKSDRWHLLTGDKKEIYKVARNDFMLPVVEGDGGPTDFIHSELLVLVDHERRIRGYYDGTEEEEVDRMINDIQRLKKYKPQ